MKYFALILAILLYVCHACIIDYDCGRLQGYCNRDLRLCQCIMGFSFNYLNVCDIRTAQNCKVFYFYSIYFCIQAYNYLFSSKAVACQTDKNCNDNSKCLGIKVERSPYDVAKFCVCNIGYSGVNCSYGSNLISNLMPAKILIKFLNFFEPRSAQNNNKNNNHNIDIDYHNYEYICRVFLKQFILN